MREITSIDRVIKATRGEPADRVANMPLVKQFCTRWLSRDFSEYNRNYQTLVECQIATQDRWKFDCFNVTGFPYREASDCGLPLNWREDAQPDSEGILVQTRSDIRKLKRPDPWDGPLMRDRLLAIQLFKKQCPNIAVLGWVEGCFAQALTFRGMENGMMDLVLDPDLLQELMDFILPLEIAFAAAQVEAGADLIGVGDAAASLVSREQYSKHIFPYELDLIKSIQETEVPAKLHICGDISHLLDDIADLDADMIDLDWMVSITRARSILGSKVCLCGNFDPVKILLQSSPEKVRMECFRCISEAHIPFVLAPGCEVPPDTPPENFTAMCEHYYFE